MEIKAAHTPSIAAIGLVIVPVWCSIACDIPALLKNTLLCSQVHFSTHSSSHFLFLVVFFWTNSAPYWVSLLVWGFFSPHVILVFHLQHNKQLFSTALNMQPCL